MVTVLSSLSSDHKHTTYNITPHFACFSRFIFQTFQLSYFIFHISDFPTFTFHSHYHIVIYPTIQFSSFRRSTFKFHTLKFLDSHTLHSNISIFVFQTFPFSYFRYFKLANVQLPKLILLQFWTSKYYYQTFHFHLSNIHIFLLQIFQTCKRPTFKIYIFHTSHISNLQKFNFQNLYF